MKVPGYVGWLAWILWPGWLASDRPVPFPPLADSVIQPQYLILIAGILLLFSLMQILGQRRRRKIANLRRRTAVGRRGASATPPQTQADMQEDMQELLVQLQELSRDINAQMDTRFARLESAIRDADDRIDALEKLIRRAGNLPPVDLAVDDSASSAADGSSSAGPAPKKTLIYQLFDAGKTPVEIAQQIGGNTGEIELILALRDKQG